MADATIANLTRLLLQTAEPPTHPHRHHHNASVGPASSSAEASFVPPPRMDRGGIPMWFGMSRNTAKSLSGVFVLLFVLLAIVLVLLVSFFLVRRCHKEKKRPLKTKSPFVPEPYSLPNNEVAHTKRVYEIQAEEGCFVEMPDPEHAEEEPGASRKSSVVGEKIMQVVRKITVAQPPPSERPKTRVQQLMSGCS
ncbi:hypothetical protein QR680_004977 [Steinernema hermaphroditum]|uniref:Uncharacterized protein n=1 Tax=Steinernema hermaphroditum TaxID=289476 RepID=A0AA39HQF3_9BILA|nr:hypothetical protein QR680_004977 [Steinernema hermaphroditum]